MQDQRHQPERSNGTEPPLVVVVQGKVKKSIQSALTVIAEGHFSEETIKMLMVDLRPIAKSWSEHYSSDDIPGVFGLKNNLVGFYELCTFFAHPHRDTKNPLKNPFMRKIHRRVSHVLQMAEVEKCGAISRDDEFDAYHGELLAGSMLTTAFLGLGMTDDARSLVERCGPHLSDIALCLLSLLQEGRIVAPPGYAHASLAISSDNGIYSLYCRVFTVRHRINPSTLAPVSEYHALGVPIVLTSARDIDHVVPLVDAQRPLHMTNPALPETPDSETKRVQVESDFLEALFETYRGADGLLHLRRMED